MKSSWIIVGFITESPSLLVVLLFALDISGLDFQSHWFLQSCNKQVLKFFHSIFLWYSKDNHLLQLHIHQNQNSSTWCRISSLTFLLDNMKILPLNRSIHTACQFQLLHHKTSISRYITSFLSIFKIHLCQKILEAWLQTLLQICWLELNSLPVYIKHHLDNLVFLDEQKVQLQNFHQNILAIASIPFLSNIWNHHLPVPQHHCLDTSFVCMWLSLHGLW